jgi:Cytochrome c554 and c-prime
MRNTRWDKKYALLSLWLIGMGLIGMALIAAGQRQEPVEQTGSSTRDRVDQERWWPTKSAVPRGAFAGRDACSKCHSAEASTQENTPMGQAAFDLSTGAPPHAIAARDFPSGAYTYRLIAEGAGLKLSVHSGDQSIARKVAWIFGAGVHGQTYLLEDDKDLYESQVSSFASTQAMDLTPGHTAADEGMLENALGERLSSGSAAHCFSCHTTASSTDSGFRPASAIPGVQCEACHGPGSNHVNAAMAVPLKGSLSKTIFNPAYGKPEDVVDFCGACHRTSMDVVEEKDYGAINVRFQPYRLQKSRCWGAKGDSRITCIACHDPHKPLVRDAGFYDRKCLACHSAGAHLADQANTAPAVCPRATANCTGCHMPKTDAPGMHAKFTDHFIRIVRANEPYPN